MYSNLHELETNRLHFRKLHAEDAIIWENFFFDNPSLDYLGIDMSMNPQEQSKDWIGRQLQRYQNNTGGLLALINKTSHEFLGMAGLLMQEVDGQQELEIGYHLLPEFWNLGFATEAARELRDYGFMNNSTESLISVIDVRNLASQNVAAKNGMVISKSTRYHGLDVFIYSILRKDWESFQN
jgi:RimJ/RimL family protein N-acetyltransferase